MREEVQNVVRSKIRENLQPVSFVSAICITNRLDRETTDSGLRNPTQVHKLRGDSHGETQYRSRIFFEVVSEGKQVVNVPSEFVCQ